jgi:hypothetical protein
MPRAASKEILTVFEERPAHKTGCAMRANKQSAALLAYTPPGYVLAVLAYDPYLWGTLTASNFLRKMLEIITPRSRQLTIRVFPAYGKNRC